MGRRDDLVFLDLERCTTRYLTLVISFEKIDALFVFREPSVPNRSMSGPNCQRERSESLLGPGV